MNEGESRASEPTNYPQKKEFVLFKKLNNLLAANTRFTLV
jgi:hypothetical protein